MNTPFISICIPVYAKNDFVLKLFLNCLTNIEKQHFIDYEIILNDHYEKPFLKEIIKQNFSEEFYNKIFFTPFLDNKSSILNWNHTLQFANGEYVNMLFPDDWYCNLNSLQYLATSAIESKCPIIFTQSQNVNISYFNTELRFNYGGVISPNINNFELCCINGLNYFGNPSTMLFKRDSSIQYDINLKNLVDLDYYLQYYKKYNSIHISDKFSVYVGCHDNSISTAIQVDYEKLQQGEIAYMQTKWQSASQ